MHSDHAIRIAATAQGFRAKRNNLIAASVSGFALACLSVTLEPSRRLSGVSLLVGLTVGFFYANGLEYAVHRFLLHAGRGFLYRQHMRHHATLQAPDAARYVNFSTKSWQVVALFLANAVPFLIIQWVFHSTWTAGVFAMFTLYYIAFEEVHWRSHMGGWMPRWLRLAAKHHLLHHGHETERFNIFLPVFDWIIHGISFRTSRHSLRRESR